MLNSLERNSTNVWNGFTDGQSLEGLTEGEETDMEDEDISLGLNSNEELVSVQGQDGQQYVVLEVIQLEVSTASYSSLAQLSSGVVTQRHPKYLARIGSNTYFLYGPI